MILVCFETSSECVGVRSRRFICQSSSAAAAALSDWLSLHLRVVVGMQLRIPRLHTHTHTHMVVLLLVHCVTGVYLHQAQFGGGLKIYTRVLSTPWDNI